MFDDDDLSSDEVSVPDYPVVVRPPKKKNKSTLDRLHHAVWRNDDEVVRHLVLREGRYRILSKFLTDFSDDN